MHRRGSLCRSLWAVWCAQDLLTQSLVRARSTHFSRANLNPKSLVHTLDFVWAPCLCPRVPCPLAPSEVYVSDEDGDRAELNRNHLYNLTNKDCQDHLHPVQNQSMCDTKRRSATRPYRLNDFSRSLVSPDHHHPEVQESCV